MISVENTSKQLYSSVDVVAGDSQGDTFSTVITNNYILFGFKCKVQVKEQST